MRLVEQSTAALASSVASAVISLVVNAVSLAVGTVAPDSGAPGWSPYLLGAILAAGVLIGSRLTFGRLLWASGGSDRGWFYPAVMAADLAWVLLSVAVFLLAAGLGRA